MGNVMRRLKIIIILLMCLSVHAHSQVVVEQRLDSMEMFIGEQVHLTLSVTAKSGQRVEFPAVKAGTYLLDGIELLEVADADTVKQDNGMQKISRKYTLTSFDDTLYYLPPVTVKVDGKPYQSKSLALKVITVEVDTLKKDEFFPAKGIQDNPFMWSDWTPIIWQILLVILLSAVGYYLYKRLRSNKPIIKRIKVVKKVLPHQKALKEIERIKSEKMTSSEDQKAYYTQLTDTLRTYLQDRFGINAMEMTSGEIIDRLRQEEDKEKLDELRELFETADLVKFAKYSALINENDRNLTTVVAFINDTKMEDMPTEEKIVPKFTEEEKRNNLSHKVLLSLIAVVALCAALLFAYIIWQVVLLIG